MSAMAYANDEGELCPLCMEEMDITDRELKPCKCGYELCLFCFYQVLQEDKEQRCPACRIPYEKEKLFEKINKFERVEAIPSERRQKSQKSKSKTSESRKHLSNVRVIKRNLVYIVGIPAHLADEEILQRREFFGQYGKIHKVSISRSNASNPHSGASSSTSVYITYARDEEAIRCIQVVNGFILDAKPLRACFGTTKYCHAWLKNMTCYNGDCLYLHSIGTQEDSFTKDEMVSNGASNIQNLPTITNPTHRRSGSVLPPPETEVPPVNPNSSSKPSTKSCCNIVAPSKSTNTNGVTGKSTVLPAAASWGQRSTQGKLIPTKSLPLPISSTTKSTAPNVPSISPPSCPPTSAAVVAAAAVGATVLQSEHSKQPRNLEILKQNSSRNSQTTKSLSSEGDHLHPVISSDSLNYSSSEQINSEKKMRDHNLSGMNEIPNIISEASSSVTSHPVSFHNNGTGESKRLNHLLGASDVIEKSNSKGVSIPGKHDKAGMDSSNETSTLSDNTAYRVTHVVQRQTSSSKQMMLDANGFDTSLEDAVHGIHIEYSKQLQHSKQDIPNEDLMKLGRFSLDDRVLSKSNFESISNAKIADSSTRAGPGNKIEACTSSRADKTDIFTCPTFSDTYTKEDYSSFHMESGNRMDYLINSKRSTSADSQHNLISSTRNTGSDFHESSIISNILSRNDLGSNELLDFLCAEKEMNNGSIDLISTRKSQKPGQSRFSFARGEESSIEPANMSPSSDDYAHKVNNQWKVDAVYRNEYNVLNRDSSDLFNEQNVSIGTLSHSTNSSYRDTYLQPPVSRSHISAPPGFNVPTRTPSLPPPGFSQQPKPERQSDWNISSVQSNGADSHNASAVLPNGYQNSFSSLPNASNGCVNDVEFIDPAIMAVGRGKLATDHIQPSQGVYDSIFRNQLPNLSSSTSNQPLFSYKSPFSGQINSLDYGTSYQVQNQKPLHYSNNTDNSLATTNQQLKMQDHYGDSAYSSFLSPQNDPIISSRVREQGLMNMDSMTPFSIYQNVDSSPRNHLAVLNSSRYGEQTQMNMDHQSHFLNNQTADSTFRNSPVGLCGWNGLNRIPSSLDSSFPGQRMDVNMADLANKERMGLLELSNGRMSALRSYADSKYQIPAEDYYSR